MRARDRLTSSLRPSRSRRWSAIPGIAKAEAEPIAIVPTENTVMAEGLHSLRHTFATRLINGTKDKDGNIKSLTPRQVADLLGHTTSEITELYYVKRDMKMLNGITDGFEL